MQQNSNMEARLKNINQQQNLNAQRFAAQRNATNLSSANSTKNFNSELAKNKLNNNSRSTNTAATKGLQAVGVPKGASEKFVNSEAGQKAINRVKKKNPVIRAFNGLTGGDKKEIAEQASDGGGANFKVAFKFLRIALIAMGPIMIIIIFSCLFIAASQIFLSSVGLGQADKTTEPMANEKINKKMENDDPSLNRELNDDNIEVTPEQDVTPAVSYNTDFTNYRFRDSKLNQYNLVQVVQKTGTTRPYNEASLDDLEDFYPEVVQYAEQYNTDTVYDFFFKLYYVYTIYLNKYNVQLDMPLLMATLNMQSSDKLTVFTSNLSKEDRASFLASNWFNFKRPESDFYYDVDWSGYVTTSTNSEHDIEILAQHMVSRQVTEYCLNSSGKRTSENILKDNQIGTQVLTCAEGEKYFTTKEEYKRDDEKYKEFLKEFLEKKYYLTGEVPIEDKPSESSSTPINNNSYDRKESASTGEWVAWRQSGQSWSDIVLGNNKSKTLSSVGCVVTSLAIQIARSGTYVKGGNIDPGIAAKSYKFDNGSLIWSSITDLTPNFQYLRKESVAGLSKKELATKLAGYDASRYYFILGVNANGGNEAKHYVAFDYVDTDTNELYMIDPLGRGTSVYDSYKVINLRIFEKKD